MIYGFLTGTILFCQGLGFKLYGKKATSNCLSNNDITKYNFIICAVVTVIISLFLSFDLLSVLYGIVQGFILYTIITFYGMAIKGGKISLCNFVMAITMLMPIAYGAIALGEAILLRDYIGLAVFIVSAYLVGSGEKSNDVKVETKYYVYLLIAGIASGLQSVWLKYTSATHEGLNSILMLATCFVLAMIITFVVQFVAKYSNKAKWSGGVTFNKALATKYDIKWAIIAVTIVGFTTVSGNICFIVFQSIADASIFFPIANGLPLLYAVIVSPIFKEKITTGALIGVILGIVAIVLLNI